MGTVKPLPQSKYPVAVAEVFVDGGKELVNFRRMLQVRDKLGHSKDPLHKSFLLRQYVCVWMKQVYSFNEQERDVAARPRVKAL